jgi:hypothetical protein
MACWQVHQLQMVLARMLCLQQGLLVLNHVQDLHFERKEAQTDAQ